MRLDARNVLLPLMAASLWPLREISPIRMADTPPSLSMRVSELKSELDERGVKWRGIAFDKEELARLLEDARQRPPASPPASSPPAPSPAPSPDPFPSPSADDAADVARMRVKEIKAELKELRVDTTGLLEKSELLSALVEARRKKSEEDANVVVGETQRMPKKEEAPAGGPAGAPGGAPGGMGGLGDILGGMGGMGGMPGGMGGMPGGMGGLGDILSGLGGMPGGIGGMQEMMSKLMSNPKAMALMQKAQANPKIMQALQDVQQNGPSAMQKYAGDPEVMAVVKEIQEILG